MDCTLPFDKPYWLGISIDDSELTPRIELTSSPYSLNPQGGLDEAYDQGGAGSGRIITADAGPVEIQGDDGLKVSGNGNSSQLYSNDLYFYRNNNSYIRKPNGGDIWIDAPEVRIANNLQTKSFSLPADAGPGKVLTSDAIGNASWQDAPEERGGSTSQGCQASH